MESNERTLYEEQLRQVNQALLLCPDGIERNELSTLKANIEELLALSEAPERPSTKSDDEFALFMAEMEKEGAVTRKTQEENGFEHLDEFKNIEGMKCRAPHKHQWGHVAYHNAMVCSVVTDSVASSEIKVRVLFINPTHEEMLPCPYYYESDCKFSDEKCRFSHGEVVLYSSLQKYEEPKFNMLKTGSSVLTKQSNNLWYRAIIRKIYDTKCLVRFESNKKDIEVVLEHVLPLSNDSNSEDNYSSSEEESEVYEDIINMSLMVKPSTAALGDWEKYTKGIGLKLMQKMGYIVGTGLGKNAEGRIDPVTAIVLPAGKSLDHCMRLREQSGGDENFFSVERKRKHLEKKEKKESQKAYEKNVEVDVFNFINTTLSSERKEKIPGSLEERQKIKQECSRNLNIRSLQIAEDIKNVERDLEKLKDSLKRHTDITSEIHLKIKDKLMHRQNQLKMYQSQAMIIKNEQCMRNNKKKMTIF